jgi:hypothetical protein
MVNGNTWCIRLKQFKTGKLMENGFM